MLVFVTVGASVEWNLFILGEGSIYATGRGIDQQLMTLAALCLTMLAGQTKAGGRMIKLFGRFETGRVVALKAVSAELSAMFVAMATKTVAVQTKKRLCGIYRGLFTNQILPMMNRVVTVAAECLHMSAPKIVSCQSVVELVSTAMRPFDQLEICPSVILVTGYTGLTFGLKRMVTP